MDAIDEGTTPEWEFYLIDGNGDPVPYTALASLEATLYDKETGELINDRAHQDALNDHDFSLNADGRGTWKLTPEDTALRRPGADFEVHVLLLEWTYRSLGMRNGKFEYTHRINNLRQTPA